MAKYTPTGFRVLIQPDSIEEMDDTYKRAKALGIKIEGSTLTKEQEAISTATIIDIGPSAWKGFDDGQAWANVGDRVVIAKFAGKVVYDNDIEYRLVNDEDILAVIGE